MLPSLVSSLLFFKLYLNHRDLHSFPTRRSSDLASFLHVVYNAWGRALPLGLRVCPTHPRATSRSEEHTSELQSRENLVCRLLLEKKKLKAVNSSDLDFCLP